MFTKTVTEGRRDDPKTSSQQGFRDVCRFSSLESGMNYCSHVACDDDDVLNSVAAIGTHLLAINDARVGCLAESFWVSFSLPYGIFVFLQC